MERFLAGDAWRAASSSYRAPRVGPAASAAAPPVTSPPVGPGLPVGRASAAVPFQDTGGAPCDPALAALQVLVLGSWRDGQ